MKDLTGLGCLHCEEGGTGIPGIWAAKYKSKGYSQKHDILCTCRAGKILENEIKLKDAINGTETFYITRADFGIYT